MYSIVLMVAMTSPADAPTFGRKHGCHGCTGCTGAAAAPAPAPAPTGCHGAHHAPVAAPVGCTGGHPLPVAAAHAPAAPGFGGYSCGGCGGCGGKFFGKKAGCWSDNGYKTSYACHGAGACFGYAYAGVNFGFAGCYGSCYGSMTNYFSYWAYPAPVYAAPMGAPVMPPPPPPVGIPGAAPPKVPTTPPAPVKPEFEPAPAGVIVALPADAKLIANGQIMKQTGAERRFVSPELIPGINYSYTFTAEITRNDRAISETIEVEVFAGNETRVTFGKLIAATATEAIGIASK